MAMAMAMENEKLWVANKSTMGDVDAINNAILILNPTAFVSL